MSRNGLVVPLAGIEPALLAELDFESSASTSSATGAFASPMPMRRWSCEAGRTIAADPGRSTRRDRRTATRGALALETLLSKAAG